MSNWEIYIDTGNNTIVKRDGVLLDHLTNLIVSFSESLCQCYVTQRFPNMDKTVDTAFNSKNDSIDVKLIGSKVSIEYSSTGKYQDTFKGLPNKFTEMNISVSSSKEPFSIDTKLNLDLTL